MCRCEWSYRFFSKSLINLFITVNYPSWLNVSHYFSLKIRRLPNFIQFRNVDQSISRLENCDTFSRRRSATSVPDRALLFFSKTIPFFFTDVTSKENLHHPHFPPENSSRPDTSQVNCLKLNSTMSLKKNSSMPFKALKLRNVLPGSNRLLRLSVIA